MKPVLFSQLEFLRAHVESVVERSAVIMITSAKDGDGKSLVAHGLAERFADSGRRVVLVSCTQFDDAEKQKNDLDRLRAYPIVTLPYDDESSPLATPVLRETIEALRARFEYTIVDGAPLLRSRVATVLASIVDAILVSVRLGRSSDGDDTALVDSLQRTDASILGVVAASPKDIGEFVGWAGTRHPGDVNSQTEKPNASYAELERASIPVLERLRR